MFTPWFRENLRGDVHKMRMKQSKALKNFNLSENLFDQADAASTN
jgi:hypothetical protein